MATLYSKERSRKKYGSKFNEYLLELERSQWSDEDKLEIIQNDKMQRILWYSNKYVPYYKTLFYQHGFNFKTFSIDKDWNKILLLDKNIVQSNTDNFRSLLYLNKQDVDHLQSSGTTGKALDIYVTYDCLQMEKAFSWLHRSWGNVKLADKQATFVGFPVVPVNRKCPPFWVYDRVENRLIFSLQHMNKINLDHYAKELARFKPFFITGYPTAIYLMALHLLDLGKYNINVNAVFTASETLLPHQREIIEKCFCCSVYDWYGAVEMIGNIVQCEKGNYHIKSEYGKIEILNANGSQTEPGNVGELVCTGLNNMAMPLIRYRVGDTAIPKAGRCSCGRAGQLVEKITGRVEDVIVTRDGRHLTRLDFVLKGLKRIEEAQLIQENITTIRVRIVKRPNYSDEDTNLLLSHLRERIGDELKIHVDFVDRIPRTANGKFRYVISKVPLHFNDGRQTGEIIGVDKEENNTI